MRHNCRDEAMSPCQVAVYTATCKQYIAETYHVDVICALFPIIILYNTPLTFTNDVIITLTRRRFRGVETGYSGDRNVP